MKILVTAGSTKVMIDKVRCLNNIFKGRTGASIADSLKMFGQEVTLLTSDDSSVSKDPREPKLEVIKYRTYKELYDLMKSLITTREWDVIIHSAAVSDYEVSGTCIETEGKLIEIDSSAKISSEHKELFLKLTPTEKIVDRIRDTWGFKGQLVKFKLQVGLTDEELLEIARKSREHSKADIIVANCLEWCRERAYIISENEEESVERMSLPTRLLKKLQKD